jgi:tripartite-type tricarboxylate transporter receptor subunit TctC
MMKYLRRVMMCLLAALIGTSVGAQSFPDKPVRFVVPYAPGGPTDIIARLLSEKLSDLWKQPVVVENRAGASGNVGSAQVAKSAPDGYTVLINTSSMAVNASLYPTAGYNLEKDLVGVVNVANSPNIIVAGTSLQAKNLREALEAAKSGKMSYGSPGAGTTPHLSAEYLFKVLARTPILHAPYKGAGPALNGALTGEIQFASVAMPAAVSLIKGGKLQGLAVTSVKRTGALPEVPTVAESGFAGFEDYTWVGVFVPTGTPKAVVTRIHADIESLLQQSAVREQLAALGFDPVGGSPESFARYIKQEITKWGTVVRETGVKAE